MEKVMGMSSQISPVSIIPLFYHSRDKQVESYLQHDTNIWIVLQLFDQGNHYKICTIPIRKLNATYMFAYNHNKLLILR